MITCIFKLAKCEGDIKKVKRGTTADWTGGYSVQCVSLEVIDKFLSLTTAQSPCHSLCYYSERASELILYKNIKRFQKWYF